MKNENYHEITRYNDTIGYGTSLDAEHINHMHTSSENYGGIEKTVFGVLNDLDDVFQNQKRVCEREKADDFPCQMKNMIISGYNTSQDSKPTVEINVVCAQTAQYREPRCLRHAAETLDIMIKAAEQSIDGLGSK